MNKSNEKEIKYVSFVFVISTKNTKKHLELLNSYIDKIQSNFLNYEVIIVNNQYELEIEEYFLGRKNITVIELGYIHSMQNAMTAGISGSIGDFVWEIYDFNSDVVFEEIIELYSGALDGYDFTYLVPQKLGFLSLLFTRVLSSKYNLIKGKKIYDAYVVLSSRRGQNKIQNLGDIVVNRNISYCMSGLLFTEKQGRLKRTSNTSMDNKIHMFFDSLIYYTNSIAKLSLIFGVLFLFTCLVLSFFGLTNDNVWFIMLGVLVSYLSSILALLVKYLHHTLRSSISAKNYMFTSIKKMEGEE